MKKTLLAAALLTTVSGCGLLDTILTDLFPETGSAELKRFVSEQELTDYFLDQATANNQRSFAVDAIAVDTSLGAPEASTPADGGTGGGVETQAGDSAATSDDFSQTTVQEQGVDEADVIKSDGTNVFVLSGSSLKIAKITPSTELAMLSEVALEGYGRELYLHDGKVVAITEDGGGFFTISGGGGGIAILGEPAVMLVPDDAVRSQEIDVRPEGPGSDFPDSFEFRKPRTVVTVIDVSTPESPSILSQTKFDGSPGGGSTRMIDGVLYMVLSNFQNIYLDAIPLLGTPELTRSSVDADAILPTFERMDADGVATSGPVLTWEEMFHPTDPDGFGVVTVISVDIDDDASFTSQGIVAQPGLVYSSIDALYLTDTQYDFSGNTRETTDVYKFDYVDRTVRAAATGSIPGRILNQYSMSEFQGNLRVATTISQTFSFFGPATPSSNNVYVLTQADTSLDTVGSIEGIAPQETIQSARFLGDRGYIVTFEQIDPLFTLDLSVPTAPRIVGELKVPGFSTFIVPMDEDHLLTVGRYIPDGGFFFGQGVQLSIFDVSDFANPRLSASAILGEETGAGSEALFNPKAFTYFAERGLLALPISIYTDAVFLDDVFVDEGGVSIGDGTGDAVGSSPGVVPVGDPGETGSEEAPPLPDELVEIGPDEPITIIAPGIPNIPEGFEGLVVFSVSADAGFAELGRISTRFEDAGIFFSSFTRGLFVGDDVFAVTDRAIRGAPVADVQSAPYELLLDMDETTAP